jgi:putative pyrroloquinoline-quinone binding quinoprotein
VLVALCVGCGSPGAPSMHDHRPRHGGVVTMAGDLHIEAVARLDGLVRIYLTDLRRNPIAPGDVNASATLSLADGRVALPLVPADDALEARGPELRAGDLPLRVDVRRGGRDAVVHLVVPVGMPSGLAGLPRVCEPPAEGASADAAAPRCTAQFPRMVRALAATPDGGTLLVAAFGAGVTVWQLPAAVAVGALDPAPGSDPEPHHVRPIDALAIRGDGREVAVAVPNEILVHTLPDGRLVGTLAREDPVGALAYTMDGTRLVTSALFDGAAQVVRVSGGDERRFGIDRPLMAAAFAPDGGAAALASELGPISLFAVPPDGAPRALPATRPAQALAVAEERVFEAAEDGTVTAWNTATGAIVWRTPPGTAILRLAVEPGGLRLAAANDDGTIRLYDARSGGLTRTLRTGTAPVQALAWAGGILAAGDTAGRLALWDVGPDAETIDSPPREGVRPRPGRHGKTRRSHAETSLGGGDRGRGDGRAVRGSRRPVVDSEAEGLSDVRHAERLRRVLHCESRPLRWRPPVRESLRSRPVALLKRHPPRLRHA